MLNLDEGTQKLNGTMQHKLSQLKKKLPKAGLTIKPKKRQIKPKQKQSAKPC